MILKIILFWLADSEKHEDQSQIEYALLELLNEALHPVQSTELTQNLSKKLNKNVSLLVVTNLLQKFAYKELIRYLLWRVKYINFLYLIVTKILLSK